MTQIIITILAVVCFTYVIFQLGYSKGKREWEIKYKIQRANDTNNK